MHQILCETFDGMFIIHDPCAGLEGSKHYVATLSGDDREVKLYGCFIDAFIPRTYIEQRYSFKLQNRSEEHTYELQSLMRISYAVYCLKKKNEQDEIYET